MVHPAIEIAVNAQGGFYPWVWDVLVGDAICGEWAGVAQSFRPLAHVELAQVAIKIKVS